MNKVNIKRGDIYMCDLGTNKGSIQSGLRPVVVLQCNKGNTASTTTIVAPITTVEKAKYMLTHIYIGDNFGLKKPSTILLEQLMTVNRNQLLNYIGKITNHRILDKIKRGLVISMGMEDNQEVIPLCYKCMNKYRYNPRYMVRRKDKFDDNIYQCKICKTNGKLYLINEREV